MKIYMHVYIYTYMYGLTQEHQNTRHDKNNTTNDHSENHPPPPALNNYRIPIM